MNNDIESSIVDLRSIDSTVTPAAIEIAEVASRIIQAANALLAIEQQRISIARQRGRQ